MENETGQRGEAVESTSLKTTSSLFAFLKDLLKLRNRPVKKLDQYVNQSGHWVHHLDETPTTKNGIAFWGSLGLRALNALQGDVGAVVQLGITTFKETKDSILRIPKITTPEPPQPSEILGPWIDGDIDDAFSKPDLFGSIEVSSSGDYLESHQETLENNSSIIKEFSQWLPKWEDWANKFKSDLVVQRLYESLFYAREQLRDQSQDWEFVLGLGRLRLGSGTDKEIDRHIFSRNCIIDLDATTGVIFVRLDDETSFRIEDDWIQGYKKPEMSDLNEVLDVLNQITDLNDESIKKELVKLGHKFRADLVTDIDPVDFRKRDSLVLAPSLILRKKGKRNLIELLQTLEDKFSASQTIPAPLLSLIEPGYGERTSSIDWSGDGAVIALDNDAYLPLKLNAKQLKALESADTRNATIIQGPPGTGKTRTIAVMISHFLAKGQRVLVAAQTPQALREVRTQLPEEIRNLAVAKLGNSKNDNDDLQKAVNSLVEAYENKSDLYENFSKYENELKEKIAGYHEERAHTIRQIVDLRSQETEQLEIEGLVGSRAHLAWTHLDRRNEFVWLGQISSEEAPAPMFFAEHSDDLGQSLRQIWSSPIRVNTSFKLPKSDELWDEDKITRMQRLQNVLSKDDPSFVLPPDFAKELCSLLEPALDYLNQLSSYKYVWIGNLVRESLLAADDTLTQRIDRAIQSISSMEELIENMKDVSQINCSKSSTDWLPLLEALVSRIDKKGDLRTSITGEIKASLISNQAVKKSQNILNKIRIMGKAPHTKDDISRIIALVKFDHAIKNYCELLSIQEADIAESRFEQSVWIKQQVILLETGKQFSEVCKSIRAYLNRKLVKNSKFLQGPLELQALYDLSLAKNAAVELKELESALTAHKALVRIPTANLGLHYVDEYLIALEKQDLERFKSAKSTLLNHVSAQEVGISLVHRFETIAPSDSKLIESITTWVNGSFTQEEENAILTKVSKLVEAFRWKRLGQALGGTDPSEYSRLFKSLTRIDDQIEGLVRQLAMRRSWKKALDRIDPNTISMMQRYALESRKLGAGTGITASRRIKEIRKLLNECVPAIPAWIMPIDEVAERFPAELELFDVVIIDEASQARLDSIFLLALSKRVVIVGDHKQVSPEGGMLADADIQEIVNRHLSGDARKANWGNADLSLFDECKAAFSNMITLTEHRRCVPEIIGFSNQIAYIPENIRLVPVRQTGSDSIQPVRTIFVPNGYVRLSGNQLENAPEAEVIVREIENLIKDSRYRGMTIGVVTLQGSAQKELINRMLIASIDPLEIETRQIKVGSPPDFQGAERNVILLSMVMAPNGSRAAQTKETMIQRYNVATSRAKDQLILVHSLKSSDIRNASDLRKQLIDYCTNVENGLSQKVDGSVGLVSNDERVEPFDSLFEQRVHNRIVERGFKVIPQFKPEIDGHDYRIDLVIVGSHGKLAVECDGDFWHGEDQFEKDLIRQEILERCGWQFFRITESRFYSDP